MNSFKTTLSKAKIFSLAFLATCAILSCDQNMDSKDTKEIAEDRNDEKFSDDKEDDAESLVNAAEINLEEIKLGQLAQKNSSTPEVVELGKMMEIDHTKALEKLQALASKKKISIPTELTQDSEKVYNQLQEKAGADFDEDYCDRAAENHKDAIKEFADATTMSNDMEIRSWAGKFVIMLQKHHDASIACKKKCEERKSKASKDN